MEFEWINIYEGSKTSYSKMYSYYYIKFFNYGRKFTNNIPLLEDVIQEVLISVWINRKNLLSINNPHTYFFTSFRNALFKKINEAKQFIQQTAHDEPEFAIDSILIKHENDRELQLKLEAALQKLTSRQREAIYLRFYEGLPYEQVSKILKITVKATYKVVARALLQIKENLPLNYLVVPLYLIKLYSNKFFF